MDVKLTITDKHNADFLRLTRQLVSEYVAQFGMEALAYCPEEALEQVACALVAHCGGVPVASGALRRLDDTTAELMRIYVLPEHRRQGLGAMIVGALEREAKRLEFERLSLVTGADMPDALSLYDRLGYSRIENYGSNCGDEICVCMAKRLL